MEETVVLIFKLTAEDGQMYHHVRWITESYYSYSICLERKLQLLAAWVDAPFVDARCLIQ